MFVELKKVVDDPRLSANECIAIEGTRRSVYQDFSILLVE